MGFNASSLGIEELDYDFNPFVEATGTTPEPSSEQMDTFRAVLAELFPMKLGENGKAVLDREKFDALADDEVPVDDRFKAALEAFTSGQPSAAEFSALPFRQQRAYIGWIVGLFFSSPEA